MPEAPDKNAPGDFYVERDCCTLCGVPWHFAPTLFAYDGSGCWVSRQPTSPDDEERMLKVFATQDLLCVRYRGADARVVDALVNIDAADQIDERRKSSGPTMPDK